MFWFGKGGWKVKVWLLGLEFFVLLVWFGAVGKVEVVRNLHETDQQVLTGAYKPRANQAYALLARSVQSELSSPQSVIYTCTFCTLVGANFVRLLWCVTCHYQTLSKVGGSKKDK